MKKGFILYKDNYEPIKSLSLSEKGELLDAMFAYNISGKVIELSPVAKMAFLFLKPTFDRDIEKYNHICERNHINGLKGGRPEKPKETQKTQSVKKEPKKAHIDIDSHIDIDKDIDTITPQAEFVKNWSLLYESISNQKFKADKKDYIIASNLIKQFGINAVLEKSKILFSACQNKNLWFTKDGIASFTISKLSSQWNGIIDKPNGDDWVKQKEQELKNARAS